MHWDVEPLFLRGSSSECSGRIIIPACCMVATLAIPIVKVHFQLLSMGELPLYRGKLKNRDHYVCTKHPKIMGRLVGVR